MNFYDEFDYVLKYADEIGRLPVMCDRPCIYILYDWREAVYVGQSKNSAESRIYGEHIKKKIFDSYEVVPLYSYEQNLVNDIEAIFIAYFNPKYNVNLPKNSHFKPKQFFRSKHKKNSKARKILNRRIFWASLWSYKNSMYYRNEVEDKLQKELSGE